MRIICQWISHTQSVVNGIIFSNNLSPLEGANVLPSMRHQGEGDVTQTTDKRLENTDQICEMNGQWTSGQWIPKLPSTDKYCATQSCGFKVVNDQSGFYWALGKVKNYQNCAKGKSTEYYDIEILQNGQCIVLYRIWYFTFSMYSPCFWHVHGVSLYCSISVDDFTLTSMKMD